MSRLKTEVNPYLTKGFSHCRHLGESTFIFRGLLFISFFDEISLCKQNSPRLDAACSAASQLGLYRLPMSHKRDVRLI